MIRQFQLIFPKLFSPDIRLRLAVSFVGGLLLGAAVALVSPGSFWNGWLAAFILSAPTLYFLLSAWSWAGGGKLLAWMIALAFLLRLALGIGLSLAIPVWGYDNDCQNAGYLFKDACSRDREAFGIAQKNEGLFWGSGIKLDNDQYGGLAYLSGWIYRYLSPDAHRPFLILIIGVFFAALGVPFLHRVVCEHWNNRVGNLAVWIYILYPDAIFFASSQMREPMLVGLSAVAFWAALSWNRSLRNSLLIMAAALLGMFFFSTRVAMMVGGVVVVWFWLDYIASRSGKYNPLFGWAGLALGMLVLFVFSWSWFRSSASYDVLVSIKSSGQVIQRIKEIGEQWNVLFTVIYGIARPVLPAAIADSDSLPLLRWVGIFRAAGWYALVPFLAYGLFTLWREPDHRRRRLALWLLLTVVVWLLVASARGGGDATDNPRYRSLFIPWMALLAAWALDWALVHRDAWLWRWMVVESIFIAFFTHWYLSRYYKVWVKLPFWEMVIWIAGLSGLVLVVGWVYDRIQASRQRSGKPV